MRLHSFLKSILGLGLAFIAAGGLYLGYLHISGNFHEVIPGVYYRSAQLSGPQLESSIQRYGIKSVVNLRGAAPAAHWYKDEMATIEKSGITHVDFPMSATKELTIEQTEQLERILKDVPKPVLVHCRAGSDRTGLASVVFLQRIEGMDEHTAEGQLSIVFGHFGLPFLRVFAMERSWEAREKSIGLKS